MRSEVKYAKAVSKWDIAKFIYRALMTEKQWQLQKKNQFTWWFGKEGVHIPLLSKVLL